MENQEAFGSPGIEPRWTSSAKEGIGTAYHTSCHLWFTLSHGIVNEIYYPRVDQPNTRDFQFLISDGNTFCHEEKKDLFHQMEYPERDCVFYRLTNSEPHQRYRITKHVLTDPHRSVLLIHTKIEVLDRSLQDKFHLYALLAPHLTGQGDGNSGWCSESAGHKFLHAMRENTHLVMGCTSGLSRRSVGYVGSSDGWTDLMTNYNMDWEFCSAVNGNIALMGEINITTSNEFTIAIAFGESRQSTITKLLQSLAGPFENHKEAYIQQWQRTKASPEYEFDDHTTDGGHLYRLSRCILLIHEDKSFQGALVASMSIPWGEIKNDKDLGGYHLVWTRDLVQSVIALLASGQTNTPIRALIWLAAIQREDGTFPQNSWINGNAYWPGLQLDEMAAPILLAWHLQRNGAKLGFFDPYTMIIRSSAYLIRHGPVTAQERWEENSGYSPSTLAMVIASLVCSSEFARKKGDIDTANFIIAYADWLSAHIEDWTVTSCGEVMKDIPRHYVRINPTDPARSDPRANPNETQVTIANGGGVHPARNIVSGDFLQLVRLGIRAANDPIISDSVKVIDNLLKRNLPQGPCWRRYNFDGYGQKSDGKAFDGNGTGRSWPILTGERGHYELAAGRDPVPYITALEKFANTGGMLSEQLWDEDDLPDASMKRGFPTTAAMPLCWAHAEYISLVRSHRDGICFDRVEPAFQRYIANPIKHEFEIWNYNHQLSKMPSHKTLRIILESDAIVSWSIDGWISTNKAEISKNNELILWYFDLPTKDLANHRTVEFTFFWKNTHQCEGKNYLVEVVD